MKKIVYVCIDDLPPDAELGGDICDAMGHRLMAAGAVLDENKRAALVRRGITSVPVARQIALTAEERILIQQQLESRFNKVVDDPLMQQLKQLIARYRLDDSQ